MCNVDRDKLLIRHTELSVTISSPIMVMKAAYTPKAHAIDDFCTTHNPLTIVDLSATCVLPILQVVGQITIWPHLHILVELAEGRVFDAIGPGELVVAAIWTFRADVGGEPEHV